VWTEPLGSLSQSVGRDGGTCRPSAPERGQARFVRLPTRDDGLGPRRRDLDPGVWVGRTVALAGARRARPWPQ